MADRGTEQATPLRKKKARERGDRVHSRELLSAMAMLGGVMVLGALSNGFVSSWGKVYAGSLRSAMVGLNGVDRQGGEELLIVAVGEAVLAGVFALGVGFGG